MLYVGTYLACLSQGDSRALTAGVLLETKHFQISLPLLSDITLPLQDEGLGIFQPDIDLIYFTGTFYQFLCPSGEISL